MAKYRGQGGKFRIGSAPPAPYTYTEVAQVQSVGSVAITRDEIEVTTLDNTTGFREFLGSFKNPGDMALTLVWDPTLASHGSTAGGLWALFVSGENRAFEIEWPILPIAYLAHFEAYVSSFPTPAITPDDALIAEVTLRVSGEVTIVPKPAVLLAETPQAA